VIEGRATGLAVAATARSRGVRGVPFTAAVCGALLGAAALSASAQGRGLVRSCCVVRASEPLHVELLRLIGSVAAPAPGLPLAAALLQVVVVVGAAELLLGWRRALGAGLACHVVATLAARAVFAAAPHPLPSLALAQLASRDTGPSALTAGLAAVVLSRERMRTIAASYIAVLVLAEALAPSLAQAEHVAAAAVGILIGAGFRVRERRMRMASIPDDVVDDSTRDRDAIATWVRSPDRTSRTARLGAADIGRRDPRLEVGARHTHDDATKDDDATRCAHAPPMVMTRKDEGMDGPGENDRQKRQIDQRPDEPRAGRRRGDRSDHRLSPQPRPWTQHARGV
jgi:hypothetical protein